MSKCRRCNRHLKTEPWATQGIGKICAQKEAWEAEKRSQQTGDVIVPYTGGNIFIERLAAPTMADNGQLALAIHTASGCRTNVQAIDMTKSPTGFNYGYGGSGPSCFALNIMLMFCKTKDEAWYIFQDFKRKFIEGANQDAKLEISRKEIIDFIRSKNAQPKWLQ